MEGEKGSAAAAGLLWSVLAPTTGSQSSCKSPNLIDRNRTLLRSSTTYYMMDNGRSVTETTTMRRKSSSKLLRLMWIWVLIVVSSEVDLQATVAQSIVFKEAPEQVTGNTSAAFWFSVVASDGSNCCVDHCAIQCQRKRSAIPDLLPVIGVSDLKDIGLLWNLKISVFSNTSDPDQIGSKCLDAGSYRDCVGGRDSYANLSTGSHNFNVWANTSGGSYLSTVYRWTVDNIPPTAAINAGPAYTNAVNLTVFVSFSKNCSTGGAFQCSSASSCDLLVYGPGTVVPSSLQILTPGLEYSIQVALSTQSPTGKVTITTARNFCSDAVGNPYQRTSNSSAVIRFNRLLPTVNIWTAIKNSQITIQNQTRTIQATNDASDLHIYLDFTDPLNITAAELQLLLNLTSGTLLPTQRKSRGNRRFGFLLTLNDAGASISTPVNVSLPGNTTFSRYGNPVADTTSVTLLYDNKRPQVQLSTTARAHTRDQTVPIIIQFTKPVFLFNSSGVTLTGGMLRSFNEVSKTTYALVVSILEGDTAKISVPENRTLDVAGNPNAASVVLQVKHYDVPAVSVALSFFITAGLLGTTIASGALAIASANLASAGAFSSQTGCVGADPSRNLLGMAGHMQIFALSEFLALSLPIEYIETARGLRWLVPHVNTPWQSNADSNNFTNVGTNVSTTEVAVSLQRRSLLGAESDSEAPATLGSSLLPSSSQFAQSYIFKWHKQQRGGKCNSHTYDKNSPSNCSTCAYLRNLFLVNSSSKHDDFRAFELWRRQLGANGTEFGPPLSAQEYQSYFVDPNLQALKSELNASRLTGWQDFQRNMFWLVVVGGGLILLHVLTILFLKWRSKTALYGALSFPRFELFLLLLALPAVCQASAFIIQGGTRTGIIVGVILLAIPTLVFLAVAMFLIYAILVRKLVQYKELRPTIRRSGVTPPPPTGRPLSLFVGEGYQGKWVRAEGDINPGIVPCFGILFEDRKGPPRLVTMINESINLRKQGLGRNGLRRIRTMNGDDEIDESSVPWAYRLLGGFQLTYILIDLGRRIALGVIFGAYRISDESWSQVALVFTLTVFQFLYLVIVKPFHRRGVQLVESLSLLCEVGVFAAALAILASNYQPQENHTGVGIFMLLLLVFSFVVQSANEWFALIRQLLSLSNSEEISPTLGLREFVVGLILPCIPRSKWSKVVTLMVPGTHMGVARRPRLSPTPRANLELDQRSSSSWQQQHHQQSANTTDASVHRPVSPGTPNGIPPPASTTPVPLSLEDYWPGGDLQQWRRQISLERKQHESKAIGSSLTQESFVVDDPIGKSRHVNVASSSGGAAAGGRSWPRRNHRVHSSDSLSDFTPSDGEVITPDVSQELKGSGDCGSAATSKELNVPHSGEIKPAPLPQCLYNVRVG